MKTKISKLLIKEHSSIYDQYDPLIAIYVIVTYKSQIIKQFKYRAWKELPLSFRDFINSSEVDCRTWDKTGQLTNWHCLEFTLRRDSL